jgi:hypothetical protein
MLELIKKWLMPYTYGSDLESYILSHNPQSIYDVEQLTRQFDNQLSQGRIL